LVLSNTVIFFRQLPPSVCQVGYFWDDPRTSSTHVEIDFRTCLRFAHSEIIKVFKKPATRIKAKRTTNEKNEINILNILTYCVKILYIRQLP